MRMDIVVATKRATPSGHFRQLRISMPDLFGAALRVSAMIGRALGRAAAESVMRRRRWKRTWTAAIHNRKAAESVDGVPTTLNAIRPLRRLAFAAELEVVPDRGAAAISKRTSLLMFSMGAGADGDAQCPLAEDVLGYARAPPAPREDASEFPRGVRTPSIGTNCGVPRIRGGRGKRRISRRRALRRDQRR